MSFEYTTLERLRHTHPAWRLLCSDHAPLIASFLHRVFIQPNRRIIAQSDLVERLEDDLFILKQDSAGALPRTASEYLDDWASNEKGWLRKFYVERSDEPHFDLTPATEKAIAWLGTLTERTFVGTGSRLLFLFSLLREIGEGSESDPQMRIDDLKKRRDEIDAEIKRYESGDIPVMDDTALRERFSQFIQMSRELLSDFREVEHNFRELDRRVRERITMADGGKGSLIEEILGARDAITDTDQGRSFQGFWDFLMSSDRQEELTILLDRVLALPAVMGLHPDPRTRRIHYDWLEAGEHTQRTVARLSQQLRRFLDDQARLENRRIMEILRNIEGHLIAVRQEPPTGEFMSVASASADIELPLERPLYRPQAVTVIRDIAIESDEEELNTAALYEQVAIDRDAMIANIRGVLRSRPQISLHEICERFPLEHGLAELISYLQLTDDDFQSRVEEDITDTISWIAVAPDGSECVRQAKLQRVIFTR